MKLQNYVYNRKRERKKKRVSVSENVRMFLLVRENIKQFVSLDRPGFKLAEEMLSVTVSQGLLIWGYVD